MIEMKLRKLSSEAFTPERGTDHSACWDLFALEDTEFQPGEIKLVKTGWACEVPEGYRVNIYVRSSTPLKKGFILANSVGIVDNDYRGELMVQLMNVRNELGRTRDIDKVSRVTAFPVANTIKRGDKIAQIEVVRDIAGEVALTLVDTLTKTERGAGGFGSTGE